ncbi:ribonuclease P protein component [Streptobacillus moniliformis]|uniref:ribonuclease P protein component n=1 Tax=Streptobacillus moniliformis TaxID=34105 RepID=UPI0007E3AD00|nr:ribonuclease P protein component [Streptobacillus moniliformis]QXW65355.1 ribonuclease P protein component [Streptobacillus moniliformis]
MEKLRKSKEFNRVYNKGKKLSGKYILIFEYNSKSQRLGFVASKKTGNSVYRSRAKRLLREAARLNIDLFRLDKEYVLVAKSIFKDKMKEIKYQDIEQDLKNIFKRKKNI